MRTAEQVNQEYSAIAGLYGDRTFKIQVLQEEQTQLKERMTQLNRELGEIQQIALIEKKTKTEDTTAAKAS